MKKSFLIFQFLLFVLVAQAQRFDWLKTYSGAESNDYPRNYIVNTVTDSQGNLYVAGLFAFSAVVDGQELMPFSPHGGDVYMPNACILKFSPYGELLWKKVLHANYGSPSFINDIQLVGDTALFVYADCLLPVNEDEYLYFYDTLITPANLPDLLYLDSLSSNSALAISSFDRDGNMKENYFLHLAYKDREGNLIKVNNDPNSNLIHCDGFFTGAFHVDNRGNIYLGHVANDFLYLRCDTCPNRMQIYNLYNGLISEVVVMVNGRQRFTDSPKSHPSTSNYRIMKFSPHFGELMACRYVFENDSVGWDYLENQQLISDPSGNHVYLMCNLSFLSGVTDLVVAGTDNKIVRLNSLEQGLVVEYDSQLRPQEIYEIVQNPSDSGRVRLSSYFGKLVIDADSNLLFIVGGVANKDRDVVTAINGREVEIGKSNAFFLKTRIGDPDILATGYARSENNTFITTSQFPKGVVASKGRLFASIGYKGNFQWRDTSITLPRGQNGECLNGTGVFVWTYDGEEVDFIDLKKASSSNPVSSSLALHDSSLYICGGLIDNVQFADTTICPSGYSIAYIARYVDTSFSSSYHPHEVTPQGIDDVAAGEMLLYPNPTWATLSVALPEGESVRRCYVVSQQGVVREGRIESNVLNMGGYPTGVYYIKIITNHIIYKQKIIKL